MARLADRLKLAAVFCLDDWPALQRRWCSLRRRLLMTVLLVQELIRRSQHRLNCSVHLYSRMPQSLRHLILHSEKCSSSFHLLSDTPHNRGSAGSTAKNFESSLIRLRFLRTFSYMNFACALAPFYESSRLTTNVLPRRTPTSSFLCLFCAYWTVHWCGIIPSSPITTSISSTRTMLYLCQSTTDPIVVRKIANPRR